MSTVFFSVDESWHSSLSQKASGVLYILLVLVTSSIQAQQTTGNLEGRILDSEARPLPGVNVVVSGPNLQGTRGASTVDNGYFRVLALPPGIYDVRMTHISYHDVIFNDVVVALGRTTSLGELKLASRTLEMPEVVISHKRALIDPTTTTVGGNLELKTFEILPIPRNFQSMLTLLPQSNASYLGDEVNIAGSTGLENSYAIDGMHVTEAFLGSGGMNLPYNFVQEIQLESGGYAAERGRALGGIVNVITRSGSNEFHADAFAFFTNNQFAGEPLRGAVDLAKGGFSEYDAGFSLSGPAIQDELWYFAAYDRAIALQNIGVPGMSFQEDQKSSNRFAGKLAWQAGLKTNTVLTVLGDLNTYHTVGPQQLLASYASPTVLMNLDPFLGHLEDHAVSLSIRGQHIISETFFVTVALSRLYRNQNERGNTPYGEKEPVFIDRQTGAWSGGYGASTKTNTIRTTGTLTGDLVFPAHTMKVGFEYEDNFLDMDWRTTNPGWIEKFSDTSYRVLYYALTPTIHNKVVSVYVQDLWQLHERLGIHIGLRWDGQYLIGESGSVNMAITDQFQPRAGFVYQLGELGTQRITGSYGRFYEQFPLYPASESFGTLANGFVSYRQNPLTGAAAIDTLDFSKSPVVLKDIRGQFFDEFTVGYERILFSDVKLGARGIYRKLREAINDGLDLTKGQFIQGNPGRGDLSFLPKLWREYSALELSLETSGEGLRFHLMYVFSRTYGNYPGVFDADLRAAMSHSNNSLNLPEQFVNSTGLLPQDRTHVVKWYGSYNLDTHLTVGASFVWQSGTPLSHFGGTVAGPPFYAFLQQRGTSGRTPSLWDLNLRCTYALETFAGTHMKTKFILDVFNVGNQREAVVIDQVHYFGLDQTSPNPTFGKALKYQPPRTLRFGIEVEL